MAFHVMIIPTLGCPSNCSYCWSSEEHEQWVINLATELREAGVDVIFDKWDLKEGHDALKFMEKMAKNIMIFLLGLVLMP